MAEYEWAIDKNGNPVNIDSVTIKNKDLLKPFYCPYCAEEGKGDKEFDVSLGKIRAPYFSHKPEDQNNKHESKEHCDAKMKLFELINEHLNNQDIFYAGINLENTISNKIKIHRINILKEVTKVDFERYVDNENTNTKIKPDVSLFNNHGKVIRAIEIVVSNPLHEKKKEALKKENIETFELKIEEPDWFKSKLHPEKEIKFEVNQDEAYNLKMCDVRVNGELCFNEMERERLPCFESSDEYEIFDFEKCEPRDNRCSWCEKKLLVSEIDYCKDCDKKKIKQEREDRERLEKINGLNADASRLFENKRYLKAIEKWKKVLDLDPEDKIAKDGIIKANEEIIKAEEEENKKQIINFNAEASRLFENKRYLEAIERWEKVLNFDTENREALNGITKAKEAERIQKIDELNEKAKKLYKNSKWIEAKSTWEDVLKIDPDNECAKVGIEKVKTKIEKDKEGSLFSWDEIPGKDSKKLIDFLELNLCIRWIKPEIIKKTDDGNTIIAISGKNSFSIKLLNEINIAILTIDDNFTDQLIVRIENNSINIYEEILEIENLDLPTSVKDFYKKSGVVSLYRPQKYAVNKNLLKNKNIVAAIPTASGKTLLAEFAMLKSIMNDAHPGKALYIVPLRALASEKYERFKTFESIKKSSGRGVSTGIATGDFDSRDDWLGQFDIIVATSEKVDSLLRNRSRWMEEITVVVADEIHLIDSPNRGPTLEIVIAKLRQKNPNMQIIALSATIGNADEIAKWLDASLVLSDWRPIVLKEGVFFGNAINFGDGSQREVKGRSRDQAISLVTDTLAEGGQCLIFESSRKNSEGMASRAGTSISSLISGETKEKLKDIAAQVRESSEVDTAQKLALCIENGSAFHHAGLISEQRKLIEGGFRNGIIKVISATPTLAAGLNLPARRVIIKGYRRYDANFGLTPIPVLEYKQMAGRAGRPRLDPYGESVLIAKSFDELEELMQQYVLANVEKIWSKLGSENALRTHILSTIATGFAQNMDELLEFMRGTFYSTQQEPWSLKAVIEKVIAFLVEKKFVIETNGLFATRLGELVSRLYIDPLSASMILDGMERIEEKGIRYNELTLLHLISKTPDMRPLYLRSNDYGWISDFIMEHSGEFIQIPPQFMKDYEWFLSEVKTACVMLDWINEVKEDQIVKKFGIGEGDIRALSETSLWLVHSMAELAKDQKRSCTVKANELAQRVEFGAGPELLELIQIRGIGRVRARKLYTAGIRSMEALRAADLNMVARIIGTKTAVKVLRQIGRAIDEPEKPEKEEQRHLGDFR